MDRGGAPVYLGEKEGVGEGMTSNQDKQWWCDLGVKLEHEFIKREFSQAGVKMNPSKSGDPYTHDFIIGLPCDLKTVRTPWKKSHEFWGIDPRNAVSINRKDLIRYARLYPNIVIIFDVQFDDHKTVRWATLWMMHRLKQEGKLHQHFYQARINSNDGNAKSSYVFDITLLPELKENK